MEMPTGTILNGRFKLMELTQSHPVLGRTYNALNQQGEDFVVRVDKEDNALSLVKTEATFLQEVKKLNAQDRFVQLVHGACYQKQIYFVTRFRPGPTLNQCLGAMPEGKFTVGTATRCAYQVLKAVEIVHYMNCLLRRIDPNVICFDVETRSIFLSDLSSVRINPASVKADVGVHWAGPQLYAPLIHHTRGSVSSRHDIESLIYLLVDMTSGPLPWESTPSDSIRSVKRQSSTDQSLFNRCPQQYGSMFMYISCLDGSETIDYNKLYVELEDCWKQGGVKDMAEQYDFEAFMCTVEQY